LYIDWSEWYAGTNEPPADYPLIYDAFLANHRGKGVNVISVGGKCWWDEGGLWLKAFNERYPEYRIPMPR
jgi:hypothetical protein